jgi:hypothetical protein
MFTKSYTFIPYWLQDQRFKIGKKSIFFVLKEYNKVLGAKKTIF